MAEIIVPRPDPTPLTTAQLMREISNAREFIESKVSGAVLMLEGRIAANASALETVRIMVDSHMNTAIKDLKVEAEIRKRIICKAIDTLTGGPQKLDFWGFNLCGRGGRIAPRVMRCGPELSMRRTPD
jgi:hypothetical protein